MSKKTEKIEALKKELKHYELYKKADRAEEVKKEIKALGGKIENKAAKPKAEKKTIKK
jgi:predicted SprT family Zn-dependent metalloprotease